MVRGGILTKLLLCVAGAAFFAIPAFASTTDGTISSVNKWAWGSKIGWINFAANNGNIHVTDAGLTGFAWNELYGWIYLTRTKSSVANTSAGVLSGSAWSPNLGWIDFSGVTINSNGVFTGQAAGNDNTGTINFSCTKCSVTTDWRPASARSTGTTGTTGTTGGGGGGGLPPEAYSPPTSVGAVEVNNGSLYTSSTLVTVTLRGGGDIAYAWVSEDPQFFTNAFRLLFTPTTTEQTILFNLSEGEGVKTIYAKFCTQWGRCGDLLSTTILYSIKAPLGGGVAPLPPGTPAPVQPASTTTQLSYKDLIINEIKKLANSLIPSLRFKLPSIPIAKYYSQFKLWLPYFFKSPPINHNIPIETFVAKLTPPSMKGGWDYMDPVPIKRFVFAPLSKEFLALEKNFPQLKNTFKQVGINRLTDISKLQSIQMHLPGLAKAMGLPTPGVSGEAMNPFKNLPLASLPPDIKGKIPADMIFAQAGGQMVDLKVALSLTAGGRPEQKINTISGKELHLTVRPEKPVKQVRGFIVFKSRNVQARAEIRLNDLVASLLFAEPAFAYTLDKPIPVEEKLVLAEFEYTDPDGDGIYTADVQSPVPVGEYEIITVMDYQDPDLGSKQIRLIAVVDPEGYVYENVDNKELRIPGAVVTIYNFNPDTKKYEEWPAKDFQQENPQITDVRGTYSFLVPGGMYYIKATAPGYLSYEGKPFPVEEGGGVHMNIELKVQYWWLKIVDWKTALLLIVALLLLFNFYKDKRRAPEPEAVPKS